MAYWYLLGSRWSGGGIEDSRPTHRNNFDALRFLGALAVLISHSFAATYGAIAYEPLYEFSNGQAALGGIAVAVFFIMSGYLITKSFICKPDAIYFIKARCLRIFPGLALVLSLTVLLGAVVTTKDIRSYLSSSETMTYIPLGLSLRYIQETLPGVFEHNPAPDLVNSSLWTLYFEFVMYIGILIAGVSRTLTRSTITMIYVIAWIASVFLTGHKYIDLGVYFLGGATFYLWRDRIPLSKTLALVSALVVLVTLATENFEASSATLGVYLVLFIALSPSLRLPNFARWGDLSYGIYIFGFPVQQTVTLMLGPAVTWYWNLGISLPVVIALALASWHFVEKPALSLKDQGHKVGRRSWSPTS